MTTRWLMLTTGASALALTAGVIAWRFAFFIAPYAWTQEPSRLRDLLQVRTGDYIADIGAGDGSLAGAMARFVGSSGLIYATELSAANRAAIANRIDRAGLSQVRVVEAKPGATNLPDDCCRAVYLRAVFHHIPDQAAFAREIVKAVRPGGRIAVIDFAPGSLWFHGADHGVTPDAVQTAFIDAGCRVIQRIDNWGGGMFLLLFEPGKSAFSERL
jgi:ubiquinone/menaquinone biosynthesis C-methylase UbiE